MVDLKIHPASAEAFRVGRTTIYKGVPMRSRLEAAHAALLDDNPDITWTYEPRCYADETRQYLPDFETFIAGRGPSYWELKPFITAPRPVMTQMSVIWKSEPTTDLWLVSDAGPSWVGALDGDEGMWVPLGSAGLVVITRLSDGAVIDAEEIS